MTRLDNDGRVVAEGIYVETDEREAIAGSLLDPHYDNPRFGREPLTVFLRPGYRTKRDFGVDMVEGCSYNDNDRIACSFPHEKQEAAWEAAKQKFAETKSAVFLQEFLRILFEKPNLILIHILSGVNRENGCSYRSYGYIR